MRITDATTSTVVVAAPESALALRYISTQAPCTKFLFQCPLYTAVSRIGSLSGELDFLPIGPFVVEV